MHNRIKLHAFFFGKNNERKGKSMIVQLIENIYQFLWGEWIHVPLPGGGSLGLSLLIILLLPAGIVFTIKTRFLPIRLFPDMVKALTANNKNGKDEKSSLSSLQTLIVSTATRVGMGNLTGVVAAISAGGAGAVFWMWITALLGSSTAFIEATLAQLHKEKDPLYGGYRGGPAYYIHHFMEERQGKKKKHTLIAVLFAISGLICWCGISQVVSNSVAESFHNDRACYCGSSDRTKEECNGQSIRYRGTDHGSHLLRDYDFCDPHESAKHSRGFCKNLQRSLWNPSGRSRRVWSSSYERSETRIILQRSRIRIRTMCSRSSRL